MNLSAVILAGGESRRMSRDKAWVEIEGQPLIARAVSTVRDSGINEVYISGRAGTDYSALRCSVLLDQGPGAGPLSGIERALDSTQAPLTLVLAVDLPRMTAAFLQKLVERCDPLTGVIPKLRGQLEPLAAIYPKRCLLIVRDCLLRCQFAARDFAEACRFYRAVKTFPVPRSDMRCFENWNSPSDVVDPKPRSDNVRPQPTNLECNTVAQNSKPN